MAVLKGIAVQYPICHSDEVISSLLGIILFSLSTIILTIHKASRYNGNRRQLLFLHLLPISKTMAVLKGMAVQYLIRHSSEEVISSLLGRILFCQSTIILTIHKASRYNGNRRQLLFLHLLPISKTMAVLKGIAVQYLIHHSSKEVISSLLGRVLFHLSTLIRTIYEALRYCDCRRQLLFLHLLAN